MSTDTRSEREVKKGHPSGRSQEIQRLVGRALRAAVNRGEIGERTIAIDCDVLQADGSTSSGNWLYCNSYTEKGNMAARRSTQDASNNIGLYPGFSWCWPVNRRIIYNRASVDLKGQPWDKENWVIKWDGAKWSGGDVPIGMRAPQNTAEQEALKSTAQLVLKGMINLSRVRFPPGTTGGNLDALARLALWEAGLGARGHGPKDEVHDEVRDDLVDRVADEALAQHRLLQVGARLAEGGDDEVGARAGHPAGADDGDRKDRRLGRPRIVV